mmetsp:Transcript_20563/g.55397  ORF Transcript_20563/g.55397 Transcript_20563/m.55397 type:complete len:311 (-) Transcript_20563:84-1016(-)
MLGGRAAADDLRHLVVGVHFDAQPVCALVHAHAMRYALWILKGNRHTHSPLRASGLGKHTRGPAAVYILPIYLVDLVAHAQPPIPVGGTTALDSRDAVGLGHGEAQACLWVNRQRDFFQWRARGWRGRPRTETAHAAHAPAAIAEHGLEHVERLVLAEAAAAKARAEVRTARASGRGVAASLLLPDPFLAKLVVHATLLRVTQRVVGVGYLHEALCGLLLGLLVDLLVGVVLERELPIGLLDLPVVRCSRHAQNPVVVLGRRRGGAGRATVVAAALGSGAGHEVRRRECDKRQSCSGIPHAAVADKTTKS